MCVCVCYYYRTGVIKRGSIQKYNAGSTLDRLIETLANVNID